MGNINTNYLRRQQLLKLNEKPFVNNQNEVTENKKEKKSKNSKKIALTLAGLAAIGLTAVAIKTGKAQKAGKFLKDKIGNIGKKTAEVGAKVGTKATAQAATQATAQAVTQATAQAATKEIAKAPIQGVLAEGLQKNLKSIQAVASYATQGGGHAAAEEVLKGISEKKLNNIVSQPAFKRFTTKLQAQVGRGNTESARKLAEKALSSGNKGEQIAGAKFLQELAKKVVK